MAHHPVSAPSTIDTAQQPSSHDKEKALAIIRREHLALAVVLNEMTRVVNQARTLHTGFDSAVLKTMLTYIKDFPDKLHHPKEDAYLFARLCQRTRVVDREIAELQQFHAAGDVVMSNLEDLLELATAGAPQAVHSFHAEFERYCEAQWQHMRLEESVVFRAAELHLLPEDWAEIAAAFGQNGDPRFGPEPDAAFRNIYTRIMDTLEQGAYLTLQPRATDVVLQANVTDPEYAD